MSKKPWTRNQILILAGIIATSIISIVGLFGKIEIIDNKVDKLEVQILKVKEDGFIGGNFTIDGNATTTGNSVVGSDQNYNIPACIGLRTADNKWVFAYAGSASKIINNGLSWSNNDCSKSNPNAPTTTTLLIGQ